MKRHFIITICSVLMFAGLVLPTTMVVGADSPGSSGYNLIQPCEGDGGTEITGGSKNEKMCGYKDFLNLVNRVITLLLYLAITLAVISFMYAGFKLLFSGGNEEAVKDAKHIFTSVVIGLVFAYGAWIIVNFIITALGVKADYDLIK